MGVVSGTDHWSRWSRELRRNGMGPADPFGEQDNASGVQSGRLRDRQGIRRSTRSTPPLMTATRPLYRRVAPFEPTDPSWTTVAARGRYRVSISVHKRRNPLLRWPGRLGFLLLISRTLTAALWDGPNTEPRPFRPSEWNQGNSDTGTEGRKGKIIAWRDCVVLGRTDPIPIRPRAVGVAEWLRALLQRNRPLSEGSRSMQVSQRQDRNRRRTCRSVRRRSP